MTRVKSERPDAQCAAAVELARDAAHEAAADSRVPSVGEHVGVNADAPRVVTHRFACCDPAYRGWEWSVVVMRAPRARHVTVSEVLLLPGSQALLAPAWLPWSERIRPGDLGPGDLLPTTEDDVRLVPAYLSSGDPEDEPGITVGMAIELGFGRRRVMSREGRRGCADRWYAGEQGPRTRMAQASPAPCWTCGFFLPLAGWLRHSTGVCGNEFATDDGRVVSAAHGCGAHSEALVEPAVVEVPPVAYDDWRLDFVRRRSQHAPGSVGDSAPAEPLGHG